ncbi:MAG: hypothetical protein KGZ25_06905 [Planctomycetes bacterium]|nr:hypothetical protein [Planctomycetota bacterium]
MGTNGKEESRGVGIEHARRLALFVLLFLFVFTHRGILGQNDLSRFVAVDSIVNRGVFYIDDSGYLQQPSEMGKDGSLFLHNIAYNRQNGHCYTTKSPVLTVLLAGVLNIFRLLGAEFSFQGYRAAIPTFVLTWLLIGSLTSLAVYFFRRNVTPWVSGLEADLVVVLSLGGTIYLSYSTTMNHHTFAASLIFISFFILRMPEACVGISPARAATAGLLMSLATVVGWADGLAFSLAFGLYLIFYVRAWRSIAAYCLGAIPLLALHCALQYPIWHTVVPFELIGATGHHAGPYLELSLRQFTWAIPRYKYWLLTLISTQGLFVLSPIVLIGVAGIGDAVRGSWHGWREGERSDASRGHVALTVVFGIILLVSYYSFFSRRDLGGACFGFRQYIGFIPLLSYYAVSYYSRHRDETYFQAFFYLCGIISLMYALIGMQKPWTLMENNMHPAVQALLRIRGF